MESNNPYDAPQQSAPSSSPAYGLRSVKIKRIDPVSTATMLGALYVFIGLIAGGFMFLFSLVGGAVGGEEAALGGLIGGVGALIGLPIVYGVMGFIGGLIGAALYNLVAGFVGGIQIDLEG